MESILAQILKERLRITDRIVSLRKLHGDASYRTYFRLTLEGGRTFIVMQLPQGISSASEEITNLKEKPAELPFVNIDRFLKGLGLPVPAIHDYDEKAGLLLLEDFGDETLEKRLPHCSEEEKKEWYRQAIDLLVRFQTQGMQRKDGCIAHKRSFDETLLNWEFNHFLEYGIEVRLKTKISEEDRKTIRQGTNFITYALTRLPQTLTHRDFQSRNLMIQNGTLKLLDFQDALMGPYLYDLVALLRDSYVTLPWTLVEELIAYYLQLKRGEGLNQARSAVEGEAPSGFARGGGDASPYKMFDWMTIQRKLKDAGRFVYIDRVKGNPNFLKHIPSSLSYVREAFERQEELKHLFEILKKYVPEFK